MGYIRRNEALTLPVLPKEHREDYCNKDEAFEAGWKSCQKHIAHCIELADVISREEAIHEVESMYSPCGKDGAGDAISRTAVLALLTTLGKTETDAGSA